MIPNTAARVAIVVPSLAGGGAERVAANLASDLALSGLGVDLITLRAGGPNEELLDKRVRKVILGRRRSISAAKPLAGHFRQNDYKAIFALQVNACFATVIAHRFSRSRARLVISERSTAGERMRRARPVNRAVEWFLIQALYPLASMIVTPSEAAAEDLRRLLLWRSSRVERIYNPILSPRLRELIAAEPTIDRETDNSGDLVISVGRLAVEKRPLDLLEAVAIVNQEREVRLLMLGEGPLRAAIVERAAELGISDRVRMPGFVANPHPLIRQADVLVLASEREGLPGVLIEALAAGTPVVSTDCHSGPREILLDGEIGRLVPVGDVHSMAEAILDTLTCPAAEVPKSALERFDSAFVLDQFREALGLEPTAMEG
ncbi:MAG: glycosyltransferase [Acidimicrobiales bacterium]